MPKVTEAPDLRSVLRWLRERQDEAIRLLIEMVRLESPSTDPGSQVPVFDLLERELTALDYHTRRLSGRASGGQLYARPNNRPSGTCFQLLLGHTDTVWPIGTLDRMPVRAEGGRMWGPGIFDMKGGIVQLLMALRALKHFGLVPELTPVVFLNSDEEIGSGDSEHDIRRLASKAARAFVMEPALEPIGKLKTSRRGGGRFDVKVTGKRAHTGLAAGEGASAIHELSHVVQKLYQLSDPDRGIAVNVGEIHGGVRPNVVADEASAVVDVRVRTRDDASWVDDQIRQMATETRITSGTTVEIVGEMDRPPMEFTPRNERLWRAARGIADSLGLEVDHGMSGGGSDGNTTSLHTATLDGLGAVGDGAHALHEYVVSDRIPERAALLAGLLLLRYPHDDPSSQMPRASFPTSGTGESR